MTRSYAVFRHPSSASLLSLEMAVAAFSATMKMRQSMHVYQTVQIASESDLLVIPSRLRTV